MPSSLLPSAMPRPDPILWPDSLPCHVWSNADDAVAAMERHRTALMRMAAAWRVAGRILCDQDVPEEIIRLQPPCPRLRPLVLVGGMGPLAGLDGFITACRIFGDRRDILLYQACRTPNRSRAIAGGDPGLEQALVDALASSIARGMAGLLDRGGGNGSAESAVDVVVLCNTAHAVFPRLADALERRPPAAAASVRLWSLTDGTVDAVRRRGLGRPLVLSTRATRNVRLFTAPLERAGVLAEEPDLLLQDLLEETINLGAKAADRERTVAAARRLMLLAGDRHPRAEALLAGCTEIPIMLRWLDEAGGPVPPLLRRTTLLDPVQLTLEANRDALMGIPVTRMPARAGP